MICYHRALAILVIGFSILRTFTNGLINYLTPSIDIRSLQFPGDPESLLAQAKPISLATIGIYELELIPDVGEVLARSILDKKKEVLFEASRMPKESKHLSLKIVHGVGEKRAAQLKEYLDFSNPN